MSAKAGSYSADMDQAPYWVAILVAMNIMLLSDIRQLVPSSATGICVFDIARAFLAGLRCRRRMRLARPATHGSNSPRCFWPWLPCFWQELGMVFWPRRPAAGKLRLRTVSPSSAGCDG